MMTSASIIRYLATSAAVQETEGRVLCYLWQKHFWSLSHFMLN